MPHYKTSFVVPGSIERAFELVSDFRNSAAWDPRVSAARKITDGPIGRNTAFELDSPIGWSKMTLPYTITTYEPPHLLVLEGETRVMTYRDEIRFEQLAGGVQILYDAWLALRGIFVFGAPLLALMFNRIGDDATGGIKRMLEQAADAPKAG